MGGGNYAQSGAAVTGGTLGGIGDIVQAATHKKFKATKPSEREERYRKRTKQSLFEAQALLNRGQGEFNQLLPILYNDLPGVEAEIDPDTYANYSAMSNRLQARMDEQGKLQELIATKRGTPKGEGRKKAAKAAVKAQRQKLKGMVSLDDLNTQYSAMLTGTPPIKLKKSEPTYEDVTNQKYQDELSKQSYEALMGDPQFDPYLTKQFADDERNQEEFMRRNLGEDWASGTPGIEARGRFTEGKERVLGNARRQQLDQFRRLQLGGSGELLGQTGTRQQLYAAPGQEQRNFMTSYGQMADAYTRAQGPLAADRGQQYQADKANWEYGNPWGHALQQSGDRWNESAAAMGGSGGGGGGYPPPQQTSGSNPYAASTGGFGI
jgi:hypothetical protein